MTVHIGWAGSGVEGQYEAVFRLRTRAGLEPVGGWLAAASVPRKTWATYTTNPLQGESTQKLVPLLRGFLQEQLPEYMVPSALVLLEGLPLTPNGKVDRRALPAPDQIRPELENMYVVPRTPVEEVLAGIWTDILGLEEIGVEDNFFDLGGHSLLATRVISRVRDSFHMEVPLRTIFEAPTIAGLAQLITEQQSEQENSSRRIAASIPRVTAPELSVDLDQLSDEEVDARLRDMLTQGDAE